MSRFTDAIAPFAQALGEIGLVLVALLDSSFIPLPQATEVMIILFVTEQPHLWIYYATLATAGSVAGCYALFAMARKGGEAFLLKRVKPGHITRGVAAFRRYGLLAVVIPSILPPPMPFKLFVLLAGVSGVRRTSFILAVTIGRGFRYGGAALLAHWYGPQARQFIAENLAQVSIWAAVGIAVIAGAVLLWRHRRRHRMEAPLP